MNKNKFIILTTTVLGLASLVCASPIRPTVTPAPTHTPWPTETRYLSPTDTPRLTNTPGPTDTVQPTQTPRPTLTPTLTPTPKPTSTSTPLPSPTQTVPACSVLPEGIFLTIWRSDPTRQVAMGCPISAHPRVEPAAWEVKTSCQTFEHGAMLWSNQMGLYLQPVIYVLYADGSYQKFEDTFDPEKDPFSENQTAPEGLIEPVMGFGKIWREESGVREALGWATAEEMYGPGRFQMFEGGAMIWLSQRGETFVFFDSIHTVVDSPTFE